MDKSFKKLLDGYKVFRDKYAKCDQSIMSGLSYKGQSPETMVIACSDSRVDPALIMQCDPGDLFVVRNVANIVPPYEKDGGYHGTSAALEYGICYLNVKHLILLGHSKCGGINALLDSTKTQQDDFISNWMSLVDTSENKILDPEEYAKLALGYSYNNCLSFPWVKNRVNSGELKIHQWFFDIKDGKLINVDSGNEKNCISE